MTDTLEGALDFVSCTDGCQVSGRTVTWDLGTLESGQSRTVAVTVQARADAPQGQRLPDAARITSGQNGDGPGANVRTDGPLVTTNSVLALPSPAGAGAPVAVAELPKTGRPSAWGAAGLLLLAAGVALKRRMASA